MRTVHRALMFEVNVSHLGGERSVADKEHIRDRGWPCHGGFIRIQRGALGASDFDYFQGTYS